jgi:hypothetical protein
MSYHNLLETSGSLLAIQEIVEIEPQSRSDVDYNPYPDQPDIEGVGCSYRDLLTDDIDFLTLSMLESQNRSDYLKNSKYPSVVARNALNQVLSDLAVGNSELNETSSAQGRRLYQWKSDKTDFEYLIVVSKPYWLTFYTSDSEDTPWIPLAVWQSQCPRDW